MQLLDFNEFPLTGWVCEGASCESDSGLVKINASVISVDGAIVRVKTVKFLELSLQKALQFEFVPLNIGEMHGQLQEVPDVLKTSYVEVTLKVPVLCG